jgi:surface protein
MFAFFGLSQYFKGSSVFFSCTLTVHVIGLLFLATVFCYTSTFNRDLSKWDVAKVTTMYASKSILENDLM